MARTSTPPTRMRPALASQKRPIRRATVLLPAPDGPTSAVMLPAGAWKLMLRRAGSSPLA
ncbi:hypothetical protein D3C81_796950 [compost metagenome]